MINLDRVVIVQDILNNREQFRGTALGTALDKDGNLEVIVRRDNTEGGYFTIENVYAARCVFPYVQEL